MPKTKKRKPITDQQFRDACSGEVDSDAVVSRGSEAGAYVQTWTWVANEDVPGHEDDETPSEEDEP